MLASACSPSAPVGDSTEASGAAETVATHAILDSTSNPGCYAHVLAAGVDKASARTPIGFSINLLGTTHDKIFVSSNGHLTFDAANRSAVFARPLTELPVPAIVAFGAQGDTTAGGQVSFGTTTFGGHAAFCATWSQLPHDGGADGKKNSFQALLVDRSDRAPGDFDTILNYDSITWEAADSQNGVDGLAVCSTKGKKAKAHVTCTPSARLGFADGNGNAFELPGSGEPAATLDNSPTALITGSTVGEPIHGRYDYASIHGVITTLPPPPTLHVPASITVPATAHGTAVVSYAATAVDGGGNPVPVSCTPPSGSSFGPLDVAQVVTCTATAGGSTATGSFEVTVVPAAPSLSVESVTASASDANGRIVDYTAVATDANDDNPVTIVCTPPSGSLFPVGVTAVVCTATDDLGHSTSQTAEITVNPPKPPTLILPEGVTGLAVNGGSATVTYQALAVDQDGNDIPVSCDPPSGSWFGGPGTVTAVQCQATADGLTSWGTFYVTVKAPQPPFLLVEPVTTPATDANGAYVTFTSSDVYAADPNGVGPLDVSCSPASGSYFSIGTTWVTCVATDSFGLRALAQLPVTVTPNVQVP